jgi:hypothetical protein
MLCCRTTHIGEVPCTLMPEKRTARYSPWYLRTCQRGCRNNRHHKHCTLGLRLDCQKRLRLQRAPHSDSAGQTSTTSAARSFCHLCWSRLSTGSAAGGAMAACCGSAAFADFFDFLAAFLTATGRSLSVPSCPMLQLELEAVLVLHMCKHGSESCVRQPGGCICGFRAATPCYKQTGV